MNRHFLTTKQLERFVKILSPSSIPEKGKPSIRMKGGVWRVMGPQGSRTQEEKAKAFVKQLNRKLAMRKTHVDRKNK